MANVSAIDVANAAIAGPGQMNYYVPSRGAEAADPLNQFGRKLQDGTRATSSGQIVGIAFLEAFTDENGTPCYRASSADAQAFVQLLRQVAPRVEEILEKNPGQNLQQLRFRVGKGTMLRFATLRQPSGRQDIQILSCVLSGNLPLLEVAPYILKTEDGGEIEVCQEVEFGPRASAAIDKLFVESRRRGAQQAQPQAAANAPVY